jgi:hypothetical protein
MKCMANLEIREMLRIAHVRFVAYYYLMLGTSRVAFERGRVHLLATKFKDFIIDEEPLSH